MIGLSLRKEALDGFPHETSSLPSRRTGSSPATGCLGRIDAADEVGQDQLVVGGAHRQAGAVDGVESGAGQGLGHVAGFHVQTLPAVDEGGAGAGKGEAN